MSSKQSAYDTLMKKATYVEGQLYSTAKELERRFGVTLILSGEPAYQMLKGLARELSYALSLVRLAPTIEQPTSGLTKSSNTSNYTLKAIEENVKVIATSIPMIVSMLQKLDSTTPTPCEKCEEDDEDAHGTLCPCWKCGPGGMR